jgi:hypothetical protein
MFRRSTRHSKHGKMMIKSEKESGSLMRFELTCDYRPMNITYNGFICRKKYQKKGEKKLINYKHFYSQFMLEFEYFLPLQLEVQL